MEKWGFVKHHRSILVVIFIAFLLRILLTPYGTLETPDMNNFRAWSAHITEHGPRGYYDTIWADYTPGYLYVLWFLGEVKLIFPILDKQPFLFIWLKLPAILSDLLVGLIIYFAVLRFNKKLAIPAASLYLFNPAIFANSALWGQVDGLTALFAMSAVFFAESSPWIAIFSLAFGAITKAPAGFVAPLVGLIWWRVFGFKRALAYIFSTAFLFVLGFVPFNSGKPLLSFVFERVGVMAGQYKYTSENAFNFWAVVKGLWVSDAGWPQILGIVMTVIICLVALWRWWKAEESKSESAYPLRFLVSAIILLGSFFFLTRMHERHLMPGLAPLSVAAAAFPSLWLSYGLFSIIYLAELRFSYVWVTQEFKWIFPERIVVLLSCINLALFGLMEWVLFKPVIRSYDRLSALFAGIKERLAGMRAAESSFVNKHWKLLLAFVLIFALGVRLYGLAQPPSFYFDEIYHSFTGVEYAKGNPDAWMWNSTAPKDRAYDWVQPPTAKILMAVGVSLFGERPIGWRISGALLGFGAVVFVYLIGMALFNNQLLSLLAAALFSLDGLPLTLARVGTNDSVFLFFTLGTVYFFIKNNYLLSSIFMGLAASTKLSAIWLPPLVVLLFFILRKKWEWRLAWFLLPPVIYLLTYAPFFIQGHTVADFGELQKQMVLYHANLKATHPFGSPWWSWPFMLTPIWFYHHEDGGIFTNIYAHGNPVIFWIGLLALIVAVASAVLSKRREVWALIIAYAGMFMPWSLSPRIMFLYHYLPSVPFLCLILAWALTSNRHWRKWTVGFFIVALLVFAYFLPRFIGLPVPQEFSDLYYKILPVVQFFK